MDLRVIVQEENVLALRTADTEIVDGRIIEAAMICHHLEVLMLPLHLLIEGKGFLFLAVVLHYNDLIVG